MQKLEQQTDYLNNQTFASRAETLEKDLDKVIMGQQMQAEELDRGLKLAKQATLKYPELVAPIASEYVRWDNTGTKIEPGGSAAIATTNFLASGVGAVSRTISAKLGDFISVKDFGAAGDGVADDTTEIQAALTAATGTTLYFPAGTYVFNSQLIVPINTHILGAGHESTILDASGATNQAFGLIQAHGSISGSLGGGLTGSVTAGDLTLTLTSAPTLSPGDLIILHDPADGSWNPVNVSYRKGEFLIVKSLSGAVITLTGAVIDDYPASAEVYLVTPTSSSFRNFRIDGKPIDTVQRPIIHIRYGRNNLVENVRFKDTGSTAMEIVDSLYPVVRNVETGKYINDARPIQSNGVSLVSVQGGIVKDSVLNADRHAAALTGGGFIVTRFSVFEHNYLASRVTNAANFHGHEEFSGYRNNHIVSHGVAVNLAGARNFLVGNDIYEGNSASSMINWNRAVSVANLIQGNRFTMLNAHFIIDAAAATDINSDTTEDGIFKFYDNEIIDLSGANRSYIHIINNGSTADNRFEFKRNIVKRTNTGFFGNFLSMSRVSGDSFDQLIVEDNTLLNTGMGIVTGVTGVNPIGWTVTGLKLEDGVRNLVGSG